MRKKLLVLGVLSVVLVVMVCVCGCPAKAPQEEAVAPPAPPAEPETAEPAVTPEVTEPVEEELVYDMGDVPEHESNRVIHAVVPPEGSVEQTEQWPAAEWAKVNDTIFVIYAKHLSSYDPDEETGEFAVWVGCPWQYIERIEKDHPFGAADAAKYLAEAGVKAVKAEMYIGPGDKSGPAPGYQAWTPQTDRCVAMVFAPDRGGNGLMKRLSIWAEMEDGTRQFLYRGPTKCYCPRYPDETAEGNWIGVTMDKQTYFVVDQWGLPGNSPVPEDAATEDDAEGSEEPSEGDD